MLGTFLDKATGLLDRNFLLAYWFPIFISASLAILIYIWTFGWVAAVNWWQQDLLTKGQDTGFSAQLVIAVGTLVLITVLAYMLQPFTRSIVRFYEGYWPQPLQRWFVSLPLIGECPIWEDKSRKRAQAQEKGDMSEYNRQHVQLFYGFPSRVNRLMPMRLGNVLRAAEDYSKSVYGLDSVFWWPRLWPSLPEAVQNDIDDSLTPMVALLNFSTLIILVGLGSMVYLGQIGQWKQALTVFVGGIILALVSYWSAVAQAQSYGERIRSAVDLYRFSLLKSLHQPLPKNLQMEAELWEQLMLWLYNGDRGAISAMEYDHASGSDGSAEGACDTEDKNGGERFL